MNRLDNNYKPYYDQSNWFQFELDKNYKKTLKIGRNYEKKNHRILVHFNI